MIRNKGAVVHLNRARKAKMINAFLKNELCIEVKGFTILDVGPGNGQISDFFSKNNKVIAVDIKDQRNMTNNTVEFILVYDETLPFRDNSFDLVISHHVIEHVNNQLAHLLELKRVLKPKGRLYLGCPNKTSPFMAGHKGNNQVPSTSQLLSMFEKAGFSHEELYTRFLKYPDRYHCEMRLFRFLPETIIKKMKFWHPSQCYILRH